MASKCKSCGAEIVWIKTAAGKSMPCDPDPVSYYAKQGARGKVVTKDGRVVSCEFEGHPFGSDGKGHIPHWSTCPTAENHRK